MNKENVFVRTLESLHINAPSQVATSTSTSVVTTVVDILPITSTKGSRIVTFAHMGTRAEIALWLTPGVNDLGVEYALFTPGVYWLGPDSLSGWRGPQQGKQHSVCVLGHTYTLALSCCYPMCECEWR